MTLRCAIYTRKSSDEGLEQSFNSLHAQREACEAYIKSQAHEGWVCRREMYDDGGFSGGSMDRPALKRLLADIEAKLVDVVVVYKVDRLTRSLTDFARIVEIFDRAGASFVSITQAFNTTTSMGRLTLNVLLSFAQFEREVTGERIRDKIAASKAKGMWMGGVLPLGYDAGDHTLVVNEPEAELVRSIFRRYLKIGSVHLLRDALEREGVRSKAWVTRQGRTRGGLVFGRGALFHLLQNPHYRGQIRHKDKVYPGTHLAIVDADLFEAAQALLAQHRITRRAKPARATEAALMGKIFDPDGVPYAPTFAYGRGGRRYGYYVRGNLQRAGRGGEERAPKRISVVALDAAMLGQLRRLAGRLEADWDALGPCLRRLEVRADGARLTLDADLFFGLDHPDLGLQDLQQRLRPGERAALGPEGLIIAVPGRLQFRGGRAWCSHPDQAPKCDRKLVAALKTAHRLLDTEGLTPSAIRRDAQAPSNPYRRKLCRIAFLAPQIQAAIFEGRQPPSISLSRLIEADLPLVWGKTRSRSSCLTGFRRPPDHRPRPLLARRPPRRRSGRCSRARPSRRLYPSSAGS
jgi:DNA invertase Pin-like site-specific DNA recombinase